MNRFEIVLYFLFFFIQIFGFVFFLFKQCNQAGVRAILSSLDEKKTTASISILQFEEFITSFIVMNKFHKEILLELV